MRTTSKSSHTVYDSWSGRRQKQDRINDDPSLATRLCLAFRKPRHPMVSQYMHTKPVHRARELLARIFSP